MRNLFRAAEILCLFFALVAPALAQNGLQSAPSPAIAGPAYDVSAGFTNLRMAIPGASSINVNGIDASGSIGLSPRWAAIVESSYVRTPSVLGTGHQGYMFDSQAGPIFYPWEHGNTRLLVRGLAGFALVDGAVPGDQAHYFRGWLLRPSFAFGGGIERAVSRRFLLRVNEDYLRTSFYNAAGTQEGQNSLRLTVSLVFRLKQRAHVSSAQVR